MSIEHTLSDTEPRRKLHRSGEAQDGNSAYIGTPGSAYVQEYLSDECEADPSWITEAVNKGELIACPRCHFLRLPAPAFPLKRPGACDVCDSVANAAHFWVVPQSLTQGLANAADWLQSERDRRATTLYALWIGGSGAADALVWAVMAQSVETLKSACAPGDLTDGRTTDGN